MYGVEMNLRWKRGRKSKKYGGGVVMVASAKRVFGGEESCAEIWEWKMRPKVMRDGLNKVYIECN